MSIDAIREKIEAICAETGLQKTTVGQMACGDAKLHERTVRRAEYEQSVIARLDRFHRSYLKKNRPSAARTAAE